MTGPLISVARLPLFPTGVATHVAHVLSPKDAFVKHAYEGQWGSNGVFDPTPPTEEEVFTRGFGLPIARRNSIAAHLRVGIIASVFADFRIVTVMCRSGASTVISKVE